MNKIIRENHPFVMVPKRLLKERPVNMDAVGLMTFFLEKPKEWNFSEDRMLKQITWGRQRLRNALKYLEEKGYLIRKKTKNSHGRFIGITYFLFFSPQKPSVEKPHDDFSYDETPPDISKEYKREEYIRKDLKKKYIVEDNFSPTDNQRPSSKDSGQCDPVFLKLAEQLAEIIKTQKNIKVHKKRLASWAREIRKLQTLDGIDPERIQKALDWYSENIGGQYIPVIESGMSLRNKFLKLESAMERDGSFTTPTGPTDKDAVKDHLPIMQKAWHPRLEKYFYPNGTIKPEGKTYFRDHYPTVFKMLPEIFGQYVEK